MSSDSPNLIVIAGPNGAGKTTAAADVLVGALAVHEFVNADIIARGLSSFQPESVAFDAGRIMLQRLHHLTAQRADVAFETTLASRTFALWIGTLTPDGYRFRRLFFWLPSADMAVKGADTRPGRRPSRAGGRTAMATQASHFVLLCVRVAASLTA
ncbi:MAG TPA: hypothetical protein VMR62_06275 [Bryobacteraceae bacterium]|jgi:predicted ABC-type ATPase|nr:hypothetical protein [Bryobacteraceae bacterium]